MEPEAAGTEDVGKREEGAVQGEETLKSSKERNASHLDHALSSMLKDQVAVTSRLAETILVLAGMRRLQGGQPPTETESRLASQAYAMLAGLAGKVAPKRLIGKKTARKLAEDMGLKERPRKKVQMEVPTVYQPPYSPPEADEPTSEAADEPSSSSELEPEGLTEKDVRESFAILAGGSSFRAGGVSGSSKLIAGKSRGRPPIAVTSPWTQEQVQDARQQMTSPGLAVLTPAQVVVRLHLPPQKAKTEYMKQQFLNQLIKNQQAPYGGMFLVQKGVKGLTPLMPFQLEYPVKCEVCGHMEREAAQLLVCDSCEKGYHLRCLTPPQKQDIVPPPPDWNCPICPPEIGGKARPPKYGPIKTRQVATASLGPGGYTSPGDFHGAQSIPAIHNAYTGPLSVPFSVPRPGQQVFAHGQVTSQMSQFPALAPRQQFYSPPPSQTGVAYGHTQQYSVPGVGVGMPSRMPHLLASQINPHSGGQRAAQGPHYSADQLNHRAYGGAQAPLPPASGRHLVGGGGQGTQPTMSSFLVEGSRGGHEGATYAVSGRLSKFDMQRGGGGLGGNVGVAAQMPTPSRQVSAQDSARAAVDASRGGNRGKATSQLLSQALGQPTTGTSASSESGLLQRQTAVLDNTGKAGKGVVGHTVSVGVREAGSTSDVADLKVLPHEGEESETLPRENVPSSDTTLAVQKSPELKKTENVEQAVLLKDTAPVTMDTTQNEVGVDGRPRGEAVGSGDGEQNPAVEVKVEVPAENVTERVERVDVGSSVVGRVDAREEVILDGLEVVGRAAQEGRDGSESQRPTEHIPEEEKADVELQERAALTDRMRAEEEGAGGAQTHNRLEESTVEGEAAVKGEAVVEGEAAVDGEAAVEGEAAVGEGAAVEALPSSGSEQPVGLDLEWVGAPQEEENGRLHYSACQVGETVLQVNDCALFCPESPGSPPYIARIQALWEERATGEKLVRVSWCFYRSDLPPVEGKPVDAQEDEVYESNHCDDNPVGAIWGPCLVLPPSVYAREVYHRKELLAQGRTPEELGPPLYLCRYFYDAPNGTFQAIHDPGAS